ncbi:hypothetical protein [Miltoncostaea oceani]|uniref:hypothetical protein n=1 Tax=Miltoncostaea oceani TaxID=2843216 RepID=UPI001C3C5325|nr:hypothetical protein [Miltoncostaea oceani]
MSGHPSAAAPGGRAQPFSCPYCGEEDLRPAEGGHHCPDCDRRFALTFLGRGAGERHPTRSTTTGGTV